MNTQKTASKYRSAFSATNWHNVRLPSFNKQPSVVGLMLLAMAGWLSAAQPEKPYQGSAEFARMKALAGTWKGNTDMGQSPMEFRVGYRLAVGGSTTAARI